MQEPESLTPDAGVKEPGEAPTQKLIMLRFHPGCALYEQKQIGNEKQVVCPVQINQKSYTVIVGQPAMVPIEVFEVLKNSGLSDSHLLDELDA